MSDKNASKNAFISEEEFLSNYHIEDYDRPSVTADVAALTVKSEGEQTSSHKLSLLMIKRGEHPFLGKWALPGGFLRSDETLEECAIREITEETGVVPSSLLTVGTFSDPQRDPRGRIISNAYVSVISEDKIEPAGGDDAEDAKWFDITFGNDGGIYTLILSSSDTKFEAKLEAVESKFGTTSFKILQNDGIAFDHAKIIASSLSLLKDKSEKLELVFDFLPEKFTLTQLQRVQETLSDVSLLTANFRRKVSSYVEETDEFTEGDSHRPARLYKKKK